MQRKDDNETALKKRLEAFHKSTKPILDYYRENQVLAEVQADNSVESIWRNIQERLG